MYWQVVANIGYAKNHIKALKHVFEEKQSDWNLDFDDDYIVMEVVTCNGLLYGNSDEGWAGDI